MFLYFLLPDLFSCYYVSCCLISVPVLKPVTAMAGIGDITRKYKVAFYYELVSLI